MAFKIYLALIVLLAFITKYVLSLDIRRTDIKTVSDENRYFTLNPDVKYRPFNRVDHAKGNIIFTSGQRIDGDHLLLTVMDQTEFGRLTDIEVSLWYPAEEHKGQIISCAEIITDLSTSDADVYFIDDGGIGRQYAEMLVVANATHNFGYQIYMYGY